MLKSPIFSICACTYWLLVAHGTYLGTKKLEPSRPQQLLVDSIISFGASTRRYTLREKPKPMQQISESESDGGGGGLLGLPEDESEMDVCEHI